MCRKGRVYFRRIAVERGEQFGRALEHLVFMELVAHSSYSELAYDISFWRTKSGTEVDLVLGSGEVAIGVKGAPRVDDRELRSLREFNAGHRPRKAIIICNESSERRVGEIRVTPWRPFLAKLWAGEIIG